MTLTPETGLLTGAGLVISYLVKELVTRHKQYQAEKAERQKLTDAHLGDLKEQIKVQREQIERHQDFYEESQKEARHQERASMAMMGAVGEKIAILTASIQRDSK